MARNKKVDFVVTDEVEGLEKIKVHHKRMVMSPTFWDNYSLPYNPNKFSWKEEKLLVDNGSGKLILNPNIKSIKNKGGIYIFLIKSPLLFDLASYLVYVGKVESSPGYGIVDRMENYYSGSYTGVNRLNIKEMFYHWADYIYVNYTLIGRNDVIESIEGGLIDALVPPINIKMGTTEMQRIVNAWN